MGPGELGCPRPTRTFSSTPHSITSLSLFSPFNLLTRHPVPVQEANKGLEIPKYGYQNLDTKSSKSIIASFFSKNFSGLSQRERRS